MQFLDWERNETHSSLFVLQYPKIDYSMLATVGFLILYVLFSAYSQASGMYR